MKVFIVTTTADLTSKDIQDYIWMNEDGTYNLTVTEVEAVDNPLEDKE